MTNKYNIGDVVYFAQESELIKGTIVEVNTWRNSLGISEDHFVGSYKVLYETKTDVLQRNLIGAVAGAAR